MFIISQFFYLRAIFAQILNVSNKVALITDIDPEQLGNAVEELSKLGTVDGKSGDIECGQTPTNQTAKLTSGNNMYNE